MATPFIAAIEPPIDLVNWVPRLPSTQQNQSSLPRTFLDAMEVREEVYVKEQKVPQEFEFDEDDTRAAHWVIYASINQTIEPAITDPSTGEILRSRRSESRSMPIGTVRLVPFPHPPHPRKGGIYVGGKLINAGDPVAKVGEVTIPSNGTTTPTESHHSNPQEQTPQEEEEIVLPLSPYEETRRLSAPLVPFAVDPPTIYHDGIEPYVKLGRLAVLKEFRGRGIAGQLISAATDWMLKHKGYFNPSAAAVGFDQLGMTDGGRVPKWRGLFCCHAQEDAVNVWMKHGFKVDEAMGRWVEEGIPHVGMFYRATVGRERESVG